MTGKERRKNEILLNWKASVKIRFSFSLRASTLKWAFCLARAFLTIFFTIFSSFPLFPLYFSVKQREIGKKEKEEKKTLNSRHESFLNNLGIVSGRKLYFFFFFSFLFFPFFPFFSFLNTSLQCKIFFSGFEEKRKKQKPTEEEEKILQWIIELQLEQNLGRGKVFLE